jgi:hypothetical protein
VNVCDELRVNPHSILFSDFLDRSGLTANHPGAKQVDYELKFSPNSPL